MSSVKKKPVVATPTRPKSRNAPNKNDAKKGGAKGKQVPVKPVVKTVELLSERTLPEPECTFPKWDIAHVDQMIDNEMNAWQNGTEVEAVPEPVVSKKVAPTPSNKNAKKVDANALTISTTLDVPATPSEPEFEDPELKQFQPYLKEWKSLLKKTKPHIVRKGFPLHPYFEEFKKKRASSAMSSEDVESDDKMKKKVVPKPKPKTPAVSKSTKTGGKGEPQDLDEIAVPPEDLSITIPADAEIEQQFIEDYQKYCDFVPLTDKGLWNEAFLTATALISQYRTEVELGNYLWERIYPKQDNNDYLPRVSQFGKYYIKLYFMGEERMVVIDDKLPQDRNGKILFTITQKKEYWPALLMKALMKLAKGKEDLLFKDPIWIFSALCGGYMPHLSPTTSPLKTLKTIRETLSSISQQKSKFNILKHISNVPQDDNKKPIPRILLATVKPSIEQHPPDSELNQSNELGLSCRKAYVIEEIRTCLGNPVLHMLTNNASWTGLFSYADAATWTADFEEELGFCKQDRLVDTNLTDFWIPFEEFRQQFSCINVLYNTKSLRNKITLFGENLFDTICLYAKEEVDIFFKFGRLQKPLPESKVQTPEPESMTVQNHNRQTENGTGLLQEDKPPLECVIRSYNWKQSQRKQLHHFKPERECIYPVRIPSSSSGTIYTIVFSSLAHHKPTTLFEILSSSAVILGTESEIFDTQLQANVTSYEERYPTHESPNEWRLWFVKTVNNSTAQTSDQPVGTTFTADITLEDETLIPFVEFFLVDNETNNVLRDATVGTRILPVSLSSSSYTLVCYAKPNREIQESGWLRIKTVSEKGVGELESIPSDNIFPSKLQGKYYPNDQNELFRYRMFVGDELNMCLYLTLSHAIPTTLQVIYSEDDNEGTMILEHCSGTTKHIVIPSLVLQPIDKNVKRMYTLISRIDPMYGKKIFGKRLELVERQFQASIEEKSKELTPQEIEQEEQKQREFIESKAQSSVSLEMPVIEEVAPVTDDKKKGGKKAPATTKEPAKKAPVTKQPVKSPVQPVATTKPTTKAPSTKKPTKPVQELRIPTGQKQPIIEEAETTEDQLDDGIRVDVGEILGDQTKGEFSFQVTIFTTSPNVIIERSDDQKEKLEAFIEDMENENPGKLDRARESREQFIRQKTFLTAKQRQTGTADGLPKTKGVVEEPVQDAHFAWLTRTPNTWLNHEGEHEKLDHQDSAEMRERRLLQKEEIEKREQAKQQRRDMIQREIENEKKEREEWIAKQQEKLNETDGELNQFAMQMRQNFVEKQREIESLTNQRREERKQAEREEAERREAERKTQQELLAQEQKALEQNKKSKAPSKSPEKKKR